MNMDVNKNMKSDAPAQRTLRGQAAIARTSPSARVLKGQAAMEYLMTYGWAILVIVIVLAVLLFYLPQFLRAPESCVFGQAGFTCSDQRPVIYVDANTGSVSLAVNVFNGQGKTVKVAAYACTTAPVANVDRKSLAVKVDAKTVSAGGSTPFETACTDAQGNAITLAPGSDFRGNFILWYNFADDVSPSAGPVERQAVASVSGPVLQQTSVPQ